MGQQSLDTVVGFRPVAVIFDMDGVLADTEPRNEQALATVLARRGARMTEDEYRGLVGQSNETSWAWVVRRFGLTNATADLQDEHVREVLPVASRAPCQCRGMEHRSAATDPSVSIGRRARQRRGRGEIWTLRWHARGHGGV